MRRAVPIVLPRAYYYGCHIVPGHYFWLPGMRAVWGQSRSYIEDSIPWKDYDAPLCSPLTRNQGDAALHHLHGWTALAFWDNSVDRRPGSGSAFFYEGEFSFTEMLDRSRRNFAVVWERFKFDVRLISEDSA